MTLVQQIQNDRYGAEYENDRYAVGWNDCSKHLERLIASRANIDVALADLAANAPTAKRQFVVSYDPDGFAVVDEVTALPDGACFEVIGGEVGEVLL